MANALSRSCLLSVVTILLPLLLNVHPAACDGGARTLSPQETAAAERESQTSFVRAGCNVTAYPTLCFDTLSSHANTIQGSPVQLARTALSEALATARSTSAGLKAISEGGGLSARVKAAMRDCVETAGNSVDQLKQSVAELGHLNMGGKDFRYQLNCIQTWVSAAITNYDTCTDGFDGRDTDGSVKRVVTSRVSHAAQLTSNALALINDLATTSTP